MNINWKRLLILELILLSLALPVYSFAQEQQTPEFPTCQTLIHNAGDIAHYTNGLHQILNGDLVSGKDDVYNIGENAVQCYCPPTGNTGTQTNFWKTNESVAGWTHIDGKDWGLENASYIAQNTSFSCSVDETPTPTISPTPSAVPTPTTPEITQTVVNTPATPTGSSTGNTTCSASLPGDVPNFAVRVVQSGMELDWAIIPNAERVVIRYGTKEGDWQYGAIGMPNDGNYTVQNLQPNTAYFFQIAGYNGGCAIGNWSKTVDPAWSPMNWRQFAHQFFQ